MRTIQRTLWEILVPTVMDNKSIRTSYHKKWDEKVRSISGGLTILKPAKGQWISPSGQLFAEKMIPVRVACTEVQIAQIMSITISHYNQEEVMAYKISDCVKFLKRDEDFGMGFRAMEQKKFKASMKIKNTAKEKA